MCKVDVDNLINELPHYSLRINTLSYFSVHHAMHCFYINLDSRPDRRALIEAECARLGLDAERFPAIQRSPGGLGCGESHLAVLRLARERGYDRILVLEDDVEFVVDRAELDATIPDSGFDVFMIGYIMVRRDGNRIVEAQTTGGYIVASHYYDTLIKRWEEGLALYYQHPEQHWNYILDQYWKPLQLIDQWYASPTELCIQRPGYSDLSGCFVDHNRKITYVSAFFLPADRPPTQPPEVYRGQFDRLVESGVSVVLFLDSNLDWTFPSNVHVVRIAFEDTWIHRVTEGVPIELTDLRAPKDTLGYMNIQHSKTEWLRRAYELNPYGTQWFAWIDFGIARLLDANTVNRLRRLPVPETPRLVTPGCWGWIDCTVWNEVQWRFCGGFLMIHGDKIPGFWEAYTKTVLETLPKFTWEVNIWMLMEWDGYDFGWVRGNHDNTVIPTNYDLCPWGNVRGYANSI
jgi:glycosyl transferase, family 25